jgi:hypothetical protein
MSQTILPKKTDFEQPTVTDDSHHELLANDPAVTAIPKGTTYDSFNSTTNIPASGPTAFGTTPAGEFGATGGFDSSATTGFGASPGFGASTSSFGGTTNSMGSTGTNNMNMGNQPVLTGSGSNAAQGADILVTNDNTDWINKKWRPAMGWIYMLTCTMDFVVFPILWSLLQSLSHGSVTSQWQPLTLQGAGLYHIAMGAVLGIAAYGRTKEKVAGMS